MCGKLLMPLRQNRSDLCRSIQGLGLGGHCIPIDPHYLSGRPQMYQYHARFIELATEINSEMPKYVLDKNHSRLEPST